MKKHTKDTQSQNVNGGTLSHLRINIDEASDFIEDKSILNILETVKQAYPFTYIGRQKFRRKIDELDFNFWIKDSDGKIIIINNKYAESLKLRISDVEGKSLSEIHDENDYQLVKNITNYIVTTSNSVIYETFSKENEGDLIQTVEFPISDIDNNVVAIIGFNQKAFKLENLLSENSDSNVSVNFEELPAVVVEVSSNFIVKQFSNKFCTEFKLNPASIVKQSLQSIFNVDFSKLVLSTVASNIKIAKEEFCFEFKAINNDPSKGYYFSFTKTVEKNAKATASSMTFDMLMYTNLDPMFIYSTDNLRFLKVNQAALKLYGYREDEFLGMDLTDLYDSEDIQTLVDSASKDTMEHGYTGPWRQKKKNGSNVMVEISKTGIEFDGKRAHFNIVKDVSKNLESDGLSTQFQSILDNSSDLILITDANGFIKKLSKSASKFLGYDKSELNDSPFLTLVTDNFRAKINTKIFHSDVLKAVELDCDIKKADGTTNPAHIASTPIFDENNNVALFTIVISFEKEIVEKTVVQKETITENVPKQIVENTLDPEILGHLFHELITPVNVIIGFSQEIAESVKEGDADQNESVEIIKQNQKILLQLMDNAVQYAELEQNHVQLEPVDILFVDVIDQIESDVTKVSSNYGKEFSYGKISSSLKFETDQSKLQVLISFLVEFAMRATKNDKIYLSAYQTDSDQCVISVKDERDSISNELFENLELIFRGDENIIRHKFGISRFMIRYALKVTNLIAHSIGAINKDGKPSEYGYTFPIKFNRNKKVLTTMIEESSIKEKEIPSTPSVKVQDAPISETSDVNLEAKVDEQLEENPTEPFSVQVNVNTQSSSQQSAQPATAGQESVIAVGGNNAELEKVVESSEIAVSEKISMFENLSCLYVEDQIDSQILFKVQMKGLKKIQFANSFEKAIPLLQSSLFDFIIMDINLQGEYNGLDALRSIQKMESHKNVPVVAVTAYVLPGDKDRFITAGFTDFISKPVLRDKLESVLDKIF